MPIADLDSIKFDEQAVGTPIEAVQFDEPQTVGQKITKPFKAQAYTAMEGLQSGVSNAYQGMDDITKYLQDKTGLSRGGAFEKAAKLYAEKADYWHQKAQEVGANKIDEVIGQAVGGAVPGITEFMLNVPYAALLGAAKSHNEGNSEALGAITEGAKRYMMGKVLHSTGVLKQPSRSAVMGGVFGAQTAAEGGSPEDIASSVGTGVLYGIPGNGKVGLREFVKPKQKGEIPTYEAELVEQPPAQIEGTKIAGQLEAPPTAINMPGPAKPLALPAPDTAYGEGFTAIPSTQKRPGYTAGEATDYEPEVEIQPVLNRSGQPYRDEASARKAAASRHIGDYDIQPLGSGYAIYPRIPREAPKPVEPAPQPKAVEEMSVDELLQNRAELSKQHSPAKINDLIIAKQAARLESGDISAPKRTYQEPPIVIGQEPRGTELLTPEEKVQAARNKPGFMRTAEDQATLAKANQEPGPVILDANGQPIRQDISAPQKPAIEPEAPKQEIAPNEPVEAPTVQPGARVNPYKAEAERLGIEYNGLMEDTGWYTFTDPATKDTFYVKVGESVEAKMLAAREGWKAKEGTPSSQIRDDQLLNGKTYPQIEQGIIEGRDMEAEIRSVAEERSFPDFEDWMNDGKMKARIVDVLKEQGMESKAARAQADELIKPYAEAYKKVHGELEKSADLPGAETVKPPLEGEGGDLTGEVPGKSEQPSATETATKPANGWAFVNGQQRPFTEYREITKGKDKGKIMITLPNGKKVKVEKKAVVRMPEALDKPAADTKIDLDARREEARAAIKEDHPDWTAQEIERSVENTVRDGEAAGVSEAPKGTGRGRKDVTLGSGLGGLQPVYEKLSKALSERGYNAAETAIKFGKDLARFVQVRPEQILRKYAPKSGTKASRENDAVIRRQRMLKGNWETRYHAASDQLTKSDRDWVVANFKNVYEKGGTYPNERIKHFAKTWNQISGEVIELAQKLGVQERVEVDKWAVYKGENKSPTRVFSNQKLAEQFISEQSQPDLYTSIMTGEKMTVTRPVTARKNYFPHVLTEEAQEALRTQNAVYAALKEAAGVNGIDIEALAQEYRPSQSARRYGSLENARVANLPNKVIVDGREVPILETNPLQIIQQHIERGSNRLAIVERYGQEGATKFFDDLYNEIAREAKDQGVANQWMWMWQKMNGTAKDGFTESFKDNPYIGSLLGNLENYGRVAKLSAATALNVITGPVPISARYGTARTTAAIMKVGAASAAKRLGVKLPFTDAIMKDIERYSMLGGHSNEALRVTADTTDIHSNIANTLMRGYGMNAINVFLNKVANSAADGAMRDALSSLRKGVDNNAIKRLWGMDKKALTDFLKNEGDFTDADITRMVKEGPTGDDVARLVQKSSTVTNLFEENAATLPASMSNGWWRRLFSYTSWFRMMGATVADSAAYAKQGNLRPLATLLTGAAATQVIADEVMGYLKGRVDQDESFFEKVFDVFAQSGLAGIAGPLMENVKWSARQGDSPLGMPNYGFWWDVSYGMYNAAKKALDQNPSRGAEDAYKTFIKNVPLLRIIDNVLEGPYSRYLEGRYGSRRDSILNDFKGAQQGNTSSSASHSSSSRGASSRTSTSR